MQSDVRSGDAWTARLWCHGDSAQQTTDVARGVACQAAQGTQASQSARRASMQFQQPKKRTTRKRTVVAGSLPIAETQRATADRAVRATHADRAVVSRPEIPSLRAGLRGQPHAQRCAHRSALAAQRNGRVCELARRHGLRELRYRRVARTVPIETTALLRDAAGSRGPRATMVEHALEQTHRSAAPPQSTTARSTGPAGMKTWGNLRVRFTSAPLPSEPEDSCRQTSGSGSLLLGNFSTAC